MLIATIQGASQLQRQSDLRAHSSNDSDQRQRAATPSFIHPREARQGHEGLTTAFQLAGYPHVVGTFWEIDEALAVRVADTFYAALATADNTIDTRSAAQALHHAVRAIRDELPATPSLWAAYLHAGA